MSRADDVRWMRRCLELARRAEGRTAPNPIVGCVIVGPGGELLAEGWHEQAGRPHAEAAALDKLGGWAPGGTLYVSLEPCAHEGKRRTRPCAPLVRDSGVARVVYGLADPFPGHGGGAEVVRAGGVAVEGPLLEDECRRANAPFVTFATEKRAHVTLKAAITLDGKIATRTGEARWITGEAARRDVHELRNRVDAVLVGAGTVTADDPLLTTRGVEGGRDAVRVVLDGKLKMSPRAAMLRSGSSAPTVVATGMKAAAARVKALEKAGAEVWRVAGLKALLRKLGARGWLSLLVEGGGETHASFLAAGLADRVLLYVAPKVVGGRAAPSWVGGEGVAKLAQAWGFAFGDVVRVGEDLRIELTQARR